jgi:hypothetical protein
VGVVIIKDKIRQMVLEGRAVHSFLHEDGNIVILILVSEIKGHDLRIRREHSLDLFEQGLRDILLQGFNALCGRANASATMLSTSTAVVSASRASLAVTFRPW